MASPITPIPILAEGHPSPFMLPQAGSLGSPPPGTGHCIALSRLPERPSVLTNKLSPNNAIPVNPNLPEPPLILSNSLPSVRHPSISRPRTVSQTLYGPPSVSSTPALSNSSSKTASPITSPGSKAAAWPGTRAGALSPKELISATEALAETKRLQELLSEADRYLIFLREDVGMTVWSQIAEAMAAKGYPCQEKGLRLRYCILKRDVDVRLKLAIEDVHTTQVEVDRVLGIGAARTRMRLASYGKKSYTLRVFEEEEEAMLKDLAATLRASGIK